MPIGLYEMKYKARRWISKLLPLCTHINPTTLTYMLFPLGMLMAACSFWGFYYGSWLAHLMTLIFGLLRMLFGTLDGFVAEHFNKCSRKGEVLNRLAPECCDILYLVALSLASPSGFALGTLAISWSISFLGLLPLILQQKPISIGPLGQTDRLVSFLFFTFVNLFYPLPIKVFFIWCVGSGFLTCLLRTRKLFTLFYDKKTQKTA